jgi:thiol:disulfide interchange protein
MNHRPTRTAFVAKAAAALAASLTALAAQALDIKPYSAEALQAAQAAGQPVAVHFRADWCPTCRVQDKSLAQLKTEKGLDITVLAADYDKEKDLKRAMNVRTQSTLIVFKGKEEKARLAGETEADKLRATLKAAL